MDRKEEDLLAALDRRMDAAPETLACEEIGLYLGLFTKRVAEMAASIPGGTQADQPLTPSAAC